MSWKNPTPVAVATIRIEQTVEEHLNGVQHLLAVRRAIPPIGGIALPGGYVNEGESAEMAVAREVEEECGLILKPGHFRPLTTRITDRNILLIFMRYISTVRREEVEAAFTPNNEVSELLYVTEHDTLCFDLHTEILRSRVLWE